MQYISTSVQLTVETACLYLASNILPTSLQPASRSNWSITSERKRSASSALLGRAKLPPENELREMRGRMTVTATCLSSWPCCSAGHLCGPTQCKEGPGRPTRINPPPLIAPWTGGYLQSYYIIAHRSQGMERNTYIHARGFHRWLNTSKMIHKYINFFCKSKHLCFIFIGEEWAAVSTPAQIQSGQIRDVSRLIVGGDDTARHVRQRLQTAGHDQLTAVIDSTGPTRWTCVITSIDDLCAQLVARLI